VIRLVTAAGAIATIIGFAVAPTQAAFSYLTAWAFAMSIALGALIFAMMTQAIAARWSVVYEPLSGALIRTFPALAVLFVPVALCAPRLYAWVDPSRSLDAEALAKLAHKAPYLDLAFWIVRTVVYFTLWIAIGELLVRRPRRALAAAGLPAVGLALTFGAFDWLMSLTPLWDSSIYGLLYFSGSFVGALSTIAVVARRRPVTGDHSGALGRLLFAFLVFWGYMELAQGLIIWIANKPEEVPWYVARGAGAWGGVFAVLIVGHFAIPFFALLSRSLKRRPSWLAIAGGWLLVMHYLDIYWLVMPVRHPTFAPHWLDLAAPCAVLGAVALVAITRRPAAVAAEDPRLGEALAYEATS
jgi:hypothetical protein